MSFEFIVVDRCTTYLFSFTSVSSLFLSPLPALQNVSSVILYSSLAIYRRVFYSMRPAYVALVNGIQSSTKRAPRFSSCINDSPHTGLLLRSTYCTTRARSRLRYRVLSRPVSFSFTSRRSRLLRHEVSDGLDFLSRSQYRRNDLWSPEKEHLRDESHRCVIFFTVSCVTLLCTLHPTDGAELFRHGRVQRRRLR